MPKLSVFNLITLDGYFAGENGDISWHVMDPEFRAFAEQGSNANNTLIFGRVTYELMAGYWPTPQAMKDEPLTARGMNSAPKIVFSKTLKSAEWANTRLLRDDMIGEIRKLKQQPGKDLTILGSGTIVKQLTQAGLIDEFAILVVPVILGKGKTMFEGVSGTPGMKLKATRAFKNGTLLLTYERAS
jgi:dihydrofolate reductase